jgi:hypothetical protein
MTVNPAVRELLEKRLLGMALASLVSPGAWLAFYALTAHNAMAGKKPRIPGMRGLGFRYLGSTTAF